MKHLKRFNENEQSMSLSGQRKYKNTNDFEMASSHLDDESIQYHKAEKQKIKNILEGVLDDISAELEEFTNSVSGETNINDTLYSSFGDYEYEIKIKRIS